MGKKKKNELCEAIYREDIKNAPDLEKIMAESIPQEKFAMNQLNEKLIDAKFEGKPVSFMGDAWMRFKKDKVAVASGVIILFLIFMAVFGPMMSPYTFRQQHTHFMTLPPRVPGLERLGIFDGSVVWSDLQAATLEDFGDAVIEILSVYNWYFRGEPFPRYTARINLYTLRGAEDHYFIFGTDNIGRDMFVRLWRGTRISLLIAFWSVIVNVTIGVILGAICGYYGGTPDMIIQRISEVLMGIPFLVLAILFIMAFGAGIISFILVIVITGWIPMKRMIRSQFYRFKDYEYVMASRTMGAKDRNLIFRHILPNAIGPLITQATFAVPAAIFLESFLSFLGLGIQAPEPSIGVLLADGQRVLTQSPHLTFFPAVVIALLMLSFTLFGNGLRDAFDPRLRGT